MKVLLFLALLTGCDSIDAVNFQGSYTDQQGRTFSQGVGVTLRPPVRYNTSGKDK